MSDIVLGKILYTTMDKNKALKEEERLKQEGYHSVIIEYSKGTYVIKGIE
jgi:hypothetical protein